MKKLIYIGLFAFAGLVMSCSAEGEKSCEKDCKHEQCDKDKKECSDSCKKECCTADKEKAACCHSKGDSTATDSTAQ